MEIDVVERLRQMREKVFHLLGASPADRISPRASVAGAASQQRQAQFVGQHLHRLREIERGECRVARNMHGSVAAHEFVVFQTGALVAEHDRDFAALRGASARLPRRRAATSSSSATPRRRAVQPSTSVQSAIASTRVGTTTTLLEHIVRAGRQRRRLRMRITGAVRPAPGA